VLYLLPTCAYSSGSALAIPELFGREHITERVWMYDLCFQVRQLCAGKTVDPRSLGNLASLTTQPRVRFL
jgi:hypothetical protein